VTGPGNAASPLSPPASTLRHAELRAADAVGALLVLWGFKRQMGRVWTVLSMTLADLRAWGAVRTVSVPGERRERYEAEVQVWRMVLRVLGSRERGALDEAVRAFEGALEEARASMVDADPEVRAAARFRAERLARLVSHTRGAVGLLRVLTEAISGRRRG